MAFLCTFLPGGGISGTDLTLTGNLTVAGTTNLNGLVNANALAAGNTTVSGDFTVVGGSTELLGSVIIDDLLVNNDAAVNGALTVQTSLAVNGPLDAAAGITGQPIVYPGAITEDGAGTLLTTAGTCYARYIGQCPKELTSIKVGFFVHSVAAVAGAGGAALNWAEIGIAAGTLEDVAGGASTNLQILAATSVDTEARAGSAAFVEKTLTVDIARDLGLWVLIAGSYQTTQMTIRTSDGQDIQGLARTRAATQPSANILGVLAFTGTPGTAATMPLLRALIL